MLWNHLIALKQCVKFLIDLFFTCGNVSALAGFMKRTDRTLVLDLLSFFCICNEHTIALILHRSRRSTACFLLKQAGGRYGKLVSRLCSTRDRQRVRTLCNYKTNDSLGGFIECARTINKLFFLPNLLIISAWIILTFLKLTFLIILGLDLFIGLCMWICVGIILHLQGCEMNWLWMMFFGFEFNLNNWEFFFTINVFSNSISQKIYFVNYWILKSFEVKGSIKKNKSITKLIIYIQWFFH